MRKLLLIFLLLFSGVLHAHNQLTVTTPHPESYVSASISFNQYGGNQTIYTVPSGKTFVLTDVLPWGNFKIMVGSTMRLSELANKQVHLVTGIRFNSGEVLVIDPDNTGSVTISGYLF